MPRPRDARYSAVSWFPSGSTPRFRKSACALALGVRHHHHEAEAARVVVDDARAVGEVQHHVIVHRIGTGIVGVLAGRLARAVSQNREAARHAEMHDEVFATRQRRDQVFGATIKRDDFLTGEPFAEFLGQRKPEIRPARLEVRDTAADEHRR